MYEIFVSFMPFAVVGSFFFTLTEWIATSVFAQWSYGLGLVVLRETITVPLKSFPVGKVIQTNYGKAKFVNPQKVLFCHKWLFSFASPFSIKSTMTLEDNPLVIGRISVGPMGFWGTWLIGWSVASFLIEESVMYRVSFFFFGWLFAALIFGSGLWKELRSARKVLQELRQKLESPTT